MNEGTLVQGKSMNVMHQTGNVAWSIFDADYGKYNRMSLENGTGGDMEVTVTITDKDGITTDFKVTVTEGAN